MHSEFKFLNANSRLVLSRGYIQPGVTAEERIHQIIRKAAQASKIPDFENEFLYHVQEGDVSFSSPIWSNYALDRGLPISCNNSHVGDSIEAIVTKLAEIATMTKNGAGTSAYFGDVRPRGSVVSTGGSSHGVMPFIELLDKKINTISQGNVRRGNCAVWIPIEHKDSMEYLEMRDEGHPIQKLSFGVTITNEWMESMLAGDLNKRKLWLRIIQKKFETGYPYLFFYDNVNDARPQVYKDRNEFIKSSNLCTEIMEYSDDDNSFVCDLASLNLANWHQWKNSRLVRLMIYFLDAVMEEYIEKTANLKYMEAAHRFAKERRALGLGILGLHTLFQQDRLPWSSPEAFALNNEIFSHIRSESVAASRELALIHGEPEVLKGYGMRNTTLNAIAPTKSSSTILGGGKLSQGIEPWDSNYFVENMAKTKITIRNPELEKHLESIDKNTDEVWLSIAAAGGSVQHLEFLDKRTKDVFKTFSEIDQKDIILQAADRQRFLDHAQSLNLMVHPSMSPTELSRLLVLAWRTKIKSQYYVHSKNVVQEHARAQFAESCVACEA
ncbi:ribonucleotide reductase of class Ia (aerobic) [Agrobacterium phage Atu_ph04]|uniref:Ribonucleotide reductase of class Ia (Aerobic) n=1 Tax=Agrobacterium phage Atu_ph04 TaxID=2024263 RepID=A0A223VZW6_9CAUD|nr:ribonucleotide reductase [Agrobacterium phage Atu_ph04]ASV44599.1 ribonucleotide reductase of class Ia (aerobic) [Agrobacterium phage Atu_ph04]